MDNKFKRKVRQTRKLLCPPIFDLCTNVLTQLRHAIIAMAHFFFPKHLHCLCSSHHSIWHVRIHMHSPSFFALYIQIPCVTKV